MTLNILIGILAIYILISLILLPFQYRYLTAIKEQERKYKAQGKKQSEMYNEMNAGELVLHENAQGNGIFFLANFLAYIIYRVKHK